MTTLGLPSSPVLYVPQPYPLAILNVTVRSTGFCSVFRDLETVCTRLPSSLPVHLPDLCTWYVRIHFILGHNGLSSLSYYLLCILNLQEKFSLDFTSFCIEEVCSFLEVLRNGILFHWCVFFSGVLIIFSSLWVSGEFSSRSAMEDRGFIPPPVLKS